MAWNFDKLQTMPISELLRMKLYSRSAKQDTRDSALNLVFLLHGLRPECLVNVVQLAAMEISEGHPMRYLTTQCYWFRPLAWPYCSRWPFQATHEWGWCQATQTAPSIWCTLSDEPSTISAFDSVRLCANVPSYCFNHNTWSTDKWRGSSALCLWYGTHKANSLQLDW